MAKKKAGARKRAEDFIQAIGTAGGALGAPGLVQFGAGDIQRQVVLGQTDEYSVYREQDMEAGVGSPNAPTPPMPRDLDGAYKAEPSRFTASAERNVYANNMAVAEFQQEQIAANALSSF